MTFKSLNHLAVMLVVLVGANVARSSVAAQPATERPGARNVQPGQTVLPMIPIDAVQKSQSGAVFQRVANTDIEVVYDRPVARGRELFGGIVAYGEVWNPGANDATTVSFSRDVTINGDSLPAGRYSLWAIPTPGDWTLIFSRAADVYHTPYPGEVEDALRLMITPQRADYFETLAFYFPMVEGKDVQLRLHWGDTVVPMMITVP